MISITIIIPSSGRQTLLKRAIDSCLSGKYAESTEVIVIPNGPDMSWQTLCNEYSSDLRVKFYYSEIPNQNVARNIGIEKANGELIRFLDDDDYLDPDFAARQYDCFLTDSLDFCSASISLRDDHGHFLCSLKQPLTESSEIAVLSRERLQLVHAHVYRRSTLGDLRWPTGIRQSEDIFWLVSYAVKKPRRWCRMDDVVGVWYQHDAPRQSLSRPSGFVHEPTALILLEAHESLVSQGRWTPGLENTVAEALWQLAHRAFPFRPFFWSRMARKAYQLDKASRPDIAMYSYPLLRNLHPLFLLWLTLPKRWLSLGMQSLRASQLGWDYRRKL